MGGVVLSRTMKPIPNPQVQKKFGSLRGLDGELIVGTASDSDCYRRTVSFCMSHSTPPVDDLHFHAFDVVDSPQPYETRLKAIPDVYRHFHSHITCVNDLQTLEEELVAQGHEGIITRAPEGLYKNGRSTMNEQGMVKVKRFKDDEAEVIGVEELQTNLNVATTNVQGYTERTSHKANKKGMNTLGALVCRWRNIEFRIGTGFTAAERDEIWAKNPIGKLVKFKYLEVGMKVAPRHPVFLGWRSPLDR
jgi:DNA ligase-1